MKVQTRQTGGNGLYCPKYRKELAVTLSSKYILEQSILRKRIEHGDSPENNSFTRREAEQQIIAGRL